MPPSLPSRLSYLLCTLLLLCPAMQAEEPPATEPGEEPVEAEALREWPHRIPLPEATIVLYQPELEEVTGDQLRSRAAVSVELNDRQEPVFGVVWFTCRYVTDRDTRMAHLEDLAIPDAKFPNAKPEQLEKLKKILLDTVNSWDLEFSLDRLLGGMEALEDRQADAEGLDNTPPQIIIREEPALLISFDGEPKFGRNGDSGLEQALNTPFFIAKVDNNYHLRAPGAWLKASKIDGPWHEDPQPPETVVTAFEAQADPEDGTLINNATSNKVVDTIVSTAPAELVVIDGPPEYGALGDSGLLAILNTDSMLFLEIGEQQYYVLLSGRWFKGKSFEGPWAYVEPDALPESFSKIPDDGQKADVRAHVPGTDEAREAVLDAQLPQTAAIDRQSASLTVTYEGEPEFRDIDGTNMAYAVNTAYDVIRVDGRYWCCHQGVWFEADDPQGPWRVATEVPKVIYSMPASSPVYHVRYCYVYGYTPAVVYCGYTPGYCGSYIYRGCVYWGTGWRYRCWWGGRYYPRPCTYGFAVAYNPYTGNWAAAVGVRGPYGGGVWVRRGSNGGWWGPARYRDVDLSINRNININNININRDRLTAQRDNIYNRARNFDRRANRTEVAQRLQRREQALQRPSTRPAQRPATPTQRPATPAQRPATPTQRPATPAQRPATPTQRPATGVDPTKIQQAKDRARAAERQRVQQQVQRDQRRNNVYSDRKGNVYRHTDKGWEQRNQSRQWSRQQQQAARDLQRRQSQQRARNTGSRRTHQYQQYRRNAQRYSRPSYQRSGGHRGGGVRGGGGARGGGRR